MEKTVEEKTGLSLSRTSLLGDINISPEQIEEITGKDIATLSDAGVSSDMLENLAGAGADHMAYILKRIKEVNEEDKLLGDDAIYFSITLEGVDSSIIIGIPESKEDKRVSLEVFYDDITWKLVGEYELKDVQQRKMPEETLSDRTIAVLREIYLFWTEAKEK